jgi:hypothetical protein
MSIINAIASGNYHATPKQVEELARSVQLGAQGPGTYLRILLGACQETLPNLVKPTRGRAAPVPDLVQQLSAIDKCHAEFYPAVLRGVADQDSDEEENQRRANFARTAASTLRVFVKRGYDLRTEDVATVTKSGLRAKASPPLAPEDRLAQSWVKTHKRIARASRDLVESNPDFAAEAIETLIEELQQLLEGETREQIPALVSHRLTRTQVREGPRAGA